MTIVKTASVGTTMPKTMSGSYTTFSEAANTRERRRRLVHNKDRDGFYATMQEAISSSYTAVTYMRQYW